MSDYDSGQVKALRSRSPRAEHRFSVDVPMAVVVGLAAFLFQVAILPSRVPMSWDQSFYLAGAKGLAEGKGYRFVTLADAPRLTLWPPLYSAYLACVWKVWPRFPENLPELEAAMALLSALVAAALTAFLIRTGVPRWWAFLLVAATVGSPAWSYLSFFLFSDPLFIALTLGLLLCWTTRACETDASYFWTGVVLGCLYLTRTAAVAFLAGVALIAYRNRKDLCLRRCSLLAGPILLSVAAWWGWSCWSGYATGFPAVLKRMGLVHYTAVTLRHAFEIVTGRGLLEAVGWFWYILPARLQAAHPVGVCLADGFSWALGLGSSVLIGKGWWVNRHPRSRWVAVPAAMYLIMLCLWPADILPRTLYPVVPLLLAWAWTGWESFLRPRRHPRRWQRGAAVLLMTTVFLNLYCVVRIVPTWSRSAKVADLGTVQRWLSRMPPNTLIGVSGGVPLTYLSESCACRFALEWPDVDFYSRPQEIGAPFFFLAENASATKSAQAFADLVAPRSSYRPRLIRQTPRQAYALYEFIPRPGEKAQ
jgi:hypothetical protein